jgi:hypothetical protein
VAVAGEADFVVVCLLKLAQGEVEVQNHLGSVVLQLVEEVVGEEVLLDDLLGGFVVEVAVFEGRNFGPGKAQFA